GRRARLGAAADRLADPHPRRRSDGHQHAVPGPARGARGPRAGVQRQRSGQRHPVRVRSRAGLPHHEGPPAHPPDRSMSTEGPLAARYREYCRAMEQRVPSVRTPADWAPLAGYFAEDFERVGVFREVQDWQQYTEMLTQWAASIDRFETTVR